MMHGLDTLVRRVLPACRRFGVLVLVCLFAAPSFRAAEESETSDAPGDTSPPAKEEEAVADLRFWLEDTIVHRYTPAEMALATGLEEREIGERLAALGLSRDTIPPAPLDRLRVLPYPGGRHPRIGFLDGAVDPHRDTKASVFLPWKDGGYVVLDLPEAQWGQRAGEPKKLIYLAHTHIPTVWDEEGIRLERIDWSREKEGVLESRRTLPDGVAFATRIVPRAKHVDLAMRLENGSATGIAGLTAQICVLLKGAPEFNAQTDENNVYLDDAAAVPSEDGKRWIVIAWERGRAWGNAPCPCIHADPTFPDLAPKEGETLRGRLFFYEGDDVRGEIKRRREKGELIPTRAEIDIRTGK